MRSCSILFVLLLSPLGLAAQTSTGNHAATLVLPPMVSSCPVRISVDRRSNFQMIWTGSKSDWIKSHDNISLDDLERALKNEPGHGATSPQAQQDRLDHRVRSSNLQHGEGLTICFNWPLTQILSADIVVHGYPASVRIIPATPSMLKDVTETFHLTARDGEPLLHSSIWTQRLMVEWVELTRLDYADGTSWQPSAPRQCRAVPSLYLAVGSAQ